MKRMKIWPSVTRYLRRQVGSEGWGRHDSPPCPASCPLPRPQAALPAGQKSASSEGSTLSHGLYTAFGFGF